MKAITLWQPWATLIAIGVKTYETRSWDTSYRGLLAIHAAKRRPDLFREALAPLQAAGWGFRKLPLGCVVCTVRLVDVLPTHLVPENERHFGDFTSGRYAWKLEVLDVFSPPIAARGMQGIWNWQMEEAA